MDGLDTFTIPDISNPCWRDEKGRLVAQARKRIRSGSRVIVMGELGMLNDGRPSNAWRQLIHRLIETNHEVVLFPVSPIRNGLPGGCEQFPLDHRPLSRLPDLVAGLGRVWHGSVSRIRWLRLHIPGASLADELAILNHDWVAQSWFNIWTPCPPTHPSKTTSQT